VHVPSRRRRESFRAQLAYQATYLRLAHTLGEFLARLRVRSQTLDVPERQRIVRLLVKEVIVGRDNITIRHSIPAAGRSPGGTTNPADKIPPSPAGGASAKCSLLRSWSHHSPLRGPAISRQAGTLCSLERRSQPPFDAHQDPVLLDVLAYRL
jgi:site-specific DNA recombinase